MSIESGAAQARANLIDVIHELALAILREQTLDELVWLIAKTTISKLGLEDCVIYLLDEHRNILVQRAAFGPKSPEGQLIVNPIEIPLGQGIVGTVAMTGQPELIHDVREDPRYIVDDEPRLSELAVPIVLENRVLGVIDSEHSAAHFYTKEHVELLTIIASMASTRIGALLTIERLNETVRQLEATRNALRREEQRFRNLYNKHPSMFFSVDVNGVVVSVNDYACQELGFERRQLEGSKLAERIVLADEHSLAHYLQLCLENPAQTFRFEGSTRDVNGQEIWLRLTARGPERRTSDRLDKRRRAVPELEREPRAHDPDDTDLAPVLIVAEDITETHLLSQELEFHACRDALTGLLNRREFETQLAEAMTDADMPPDRQALCFVDLDKFKLVNDTCGHAAGDALLRHVAQRLTERVRRSDLVGRIGGDEFAILMRDCSLADAKRSAELLLECLATEPFHWDTHIFAVGASIGVAALDAGTGTVDDVFSAADSACLDAKAHGRNRVHVHRDRALDNARRESDNRWGTRIAKALNEDAFALYAQPIVALTELTEPAPASSVSVTRAPLHAEVLLRMHDGEGGLIPPGAFVPAAERFSLAVRLDQWVVEQTLRWLERSGLPSSSANPHCIAINLSAASICDPKFLDFLAANVRASPVAPRSLCFEITETVAITETSRARSFIKQLGALGCRFALDDFGSGLSSFGYLKSFPVDFLKIDSVYVRDLHSDPLNLAMVRSIAEMGHLLGMRVVAECVHDSAVLEHLTEVGVDFVQGFAVAQPMPIEALTGDHVPATTTAPELRVSQ
ncbi:MAG: EAL domain-containing protein [Gammaproteobacteria bacterium]|nr:EAL domain-containing protein [Gammaproteobacteria bacterium]